ncbi:MAG: hypothetical protein ACYTEQ_14385, partial [Planctomycetota bacterium]
KPRAGATDERYDIIISNNIINYGMYVGIQAYSDNMIITSNLLRDIGQGALTLGVGILTKGTNVVISSNMILEYEQKGIQVLTPSVNTTAAAT